MEKFRSNIQQKQDKEMYYGVGSFLFEVIKIFLFVLIIIIPVRVFLFQPFFVQGASMEPNFAQGEYLIVNELGYKEVSLGIGDTHFFSVHPFRNLERGDAVVFRYPKNPSQFFIKRVVGLPGESIRIFEGKVTIVSDEYPEGIVLDESNYLEGNIETQGNMRINIRNDEYFVMGDNRGASHDSRAFGSVPFDKIVGKVLLRAWPVQKLSLFQGE